MRRWCHCAATTPRLQPPRSPLLARAVVSPHPHLHVSALSIPHRRLSHVFSLLRTPPRLPHRCSSPRIPPYIHTSIHQPPHRRTPARPHIISAATNQTTLAPCPRSPYSPGNLSLSPVLLLFSPPPRARHQVALTSLGFARATQVACISSLSHFLVARRRQVAARERRGNGSHFNIACCCCRRHSCVRLLF